MPVAPDCAAPVTLRWVPPAVGVALLSLLLGLAPSADATGPKIVQPGSRASDDARALIERGKRSEHGVGAAQDIDRAIELYCEAAQLGNAEAHYRLGSIYVTGRAGAVDEPLAASWFHAAADRDNAWARAELNKLGVVDPQILPFPDCVLRADMVARRLPRSRPPTGEPAQDRSPDAEPSMIVRSLEKRDIQALVRRLAPDYGLDPALVMAVINVESSYNPSARSPKNAQGLMQLIPATASRFGVQNVWDPVDNIRGGMAYLRWLLDHFNGDLELALAGYNAGENAVAKYGGIPPYPETQVYVKRITKILGRTQTSLASSL